MIGFDDALQRLLASVVPRGPERVPLEAALGRVLAEDLTARAPIPPFDYSAMDGYALCAADLAGSAPFRLPVQGESAAGGAPAPLARGTACRIFTGAELPAGADAVVAQEDVIRTEAAGGARIELAAVPRRGAHVRARGEDLTGGAVAIAQGTRLTAGKLALAAALDRPSVLVARHPVVTVLCSGNELRAPGEPGREGSIAESNGLFVALAARSAGAIARVGAFVRDDVHLAQVAAQEALLGTDLLVTIGGVSVGDHDVMRPALEAAGVTLDFWRVAIKPGKPLAIGHAGATHVLGLPGNPASASLTFLLFGVPLLRAMQGDPAPLPPLHPMRVVGGLRRKPGRQEFLRARLRAENGEESAQICANQASGAVTSFAEADALVVVPPDREGIADGDRLDVIRIAEI